ncbi:uncharacterized protein [Apostichopus japonicus]|uniref:uncharacterized protein n=1 Tax=Stichopus japonicus TaxID=307972 RepID=UPI003AB467D8
MAQQQLLRIVTCMWIMNLAVSQDLRLTISDGSVPMPQSNNYYNQRQQFVSQQGDDVPVPSNEQYQVPQFIPQVPELNQEQLRLPSDVPPSEKIPYGNDGLMAPSNQQFQVPKFIPQVPELNREQPGFAPVVPPSEKIPYGNDGLMAPSNQQYQVPQFIPQVPELNREQPGFAPVVPPSENIPYGNDGLMAPSNQQYQVPQFIPQAPELNQEQPGLPPVVPPSEKIPYGNDYLMPPANQQFQVPQFIPQAPAWNGEQLRLPSDVPQSEKIPYGNDGLMAPSNQQYQVPQFLPQAPEQPGLPPVIPPSEKIPYGNDGLMAPSNRQFQVPQLIQKAPELNQEQLRLPSDVPPSEKIPYGNDYLMPPANQQFQVPKFIPQVPEQPGLPPVIPPSENIQYDNNIEFESSQQGLSSESSSDGEDSVHSNSDYDSNYQYSGGNYGGYYSILNKLGNEANGNEVGDGSDGVNLSDWPSYPNSYDEESWKPPSEGEISNELSILFSDNFPPRKENLLVSRKEGESVKGKLQDIRRQKRSSGSHGPISTLRNNRKVIGHLKNDPTQKLWPSIKQYLGPVSGIFQSSIGGASWTSLPPSNDDNHVGSGDGASLLDQVSGKSDDSQSWSYSYDYPSVSVNDSYDPIQLGGMSSKPDSEDGHGSESLGNSGGSDSLGIEENSLPILPPSKIPDSVNSGEVGSDHVVTSTSGILKSTEGSSEGIVLGKPSYEMYSMFTSYVSSHYEYEFLPNEISEGLDDEPSSVKGSDATISLTAHASATDASSENEHLETQNPKSFENRISDINNGKKVSDILNNVVGQLTDSNFGGGREGTDSDYDYSSYPEESSLELSLPSSDYDYSSYPQESSLKLSPPSSNSDYNVRNGGFAVHSWDTSPSYGSSELNSLDSNEGGFLETFFGIGISDSGSGNGPANDGNHDSIGIGPIWPPRSQTLVHTESVGPAIHIDSFPSEGAASQTGEEVKTAAVNVPKTNLQAKGTSSKNIVGGTSIWVYCIPLFLLIVLILLIRSNSYFGHSPKIVTVDPESNITRSKIDARTKEIEPLLREKMEYTDESS